MSSPQKNTKPASRWAFLSQAVASVESRLDTILADEEEVPKRPTPQPRTPNENGSGSRASSDLGRSDSTSRTNDRLQARLAQAMAKKSNSRVNSPAPESGPVSRTATPTPSEPAVRQPQEESKDLKQERAEDKIPELSVTAPAETDFPEGTESVDNNDKPEEAPTDVQLHSKATFGRKSTDSGRNSRDALSMASSLGDLSDPDGILLNAQLEHENVKSNMQEEIDGYIERIDALHAKLQYLTKEMTESARQACAQADADSKEKKLAEKDEKIALLMEEGQKLSKSEMKYMTIIKRLRSQAVTTTKEQDAVRRRAEKAEQSLLTLEEKAKRVEAVNRRAGEKVAALTKSSQDLEAIKKERNALNATITEVRGQLAQANKRAEEAELKAQSDKFEAEKKKNTELLDDISSAKIERELAEDKFKREITDLKSSLEREKEQARLMETEMLAEQAALESKLEAFRARAEEASSGDHGDTQAKLLRQVETLQSQYANASQNWQGIESTLLARITALEKERDEVAGREADLRRKLRDATLKAKNNAKDLEEARHSLAVAHDEEADTKLEAQKLTRRNEQLEADLLKSKKELDEQKQKADRELNRRIEEEKAKWTATIQRRTESPSASMRRAMGIDTLMSPVGIDRPISRKSSIHPPYTDSHTPSRQYSIASPRGLSNGAVPETPSVGALLDQDDFFAGVPPTPASATHADSGDRGLNDVISASTVGAGPSVQLVERMSANVRRLESEKAALKDEMARLSTQRDEARQEVVNLMREVEQKRSTDDRLKALEQQHAEVSEKYQATLELLGEKSEQVEELKADIADVKQMYRHLADTMGK